ncbi:MAG: sensor histidine kinase [Pseudomonadales bacterium]|nr:sensor histidine kinase [Pseudomonadales bacterium]
MTQTSDLRARLGITVRIEPRDIAFTLLICTLIAVLLWVGTNDPFLDHLTFSLCIGFSVHGLFSLLLQFSRNRTSVLRVYLLAIPGGVVTGLCLAGLILGYPLARIFADWASSFSSMVIAVVASYVFYSYYTMMEMREALRREEFNRLENEKNLAQARLLALQSQIEPHFLFNTLSNIQSLMSTDQKSADRMLQQLTGLLRVALRRGNSIWCTLRDELELVRNYLSINEIRMGERLQWSLTVNVHDEAVRIPPLIIQPLVENAVVHGLETREEGGRVDIDVSESAGTLIFRIADTGVGLGNSSHAGHGIGFRNIRERLATLYGERGTVTLSDNEPHGLIVTVTVPAEAGEDLPATLQGVPR